MAQRNFWWCDAMVLRGRHHNTTSCLRSADHQRKKKKATNEPPTHPCSSTGQTSKRYPPSHRPPQRIPIRPAPTPAQEIQTDLTRKGWNGTGRCRYATSLCMDLGCFSFCVGIAFWRR
ncbi:hypothetical protein BJ508DRAFT_131196 [Ascobolus immersus RN42]|uniref:Uncharacterized protein n=1 Tax=Ascobolus immersus RN42 TaxID=1160509 RepID=A0A3N4I443_ASCIM|nr:hypothetical protein BJ508DRAFT_131196 [Ascobolus immersus RN42]